MTRHKVSAVQKQMCSKKDCEKEIKKKKSKHTDVMMRRACHTQIRLAFNPKSIIAQQNFQRCPQHLIQKRQILKRYTHSSKTLHWLLHVDRSCVSLSSLLL